MSHTDVSRSIARVLIVGADLRVVDDVRRCAIAAGIETDEVSSLSQARSRWSTADVVVVGDDQINDRACGSLPARAGVLVVSRDLSDSSPWRLAVMLGAEHVVDVGSQLSDLLDRFTVRGSARATVLAVAGGSGGAGASVTAAVLAMSGSMLGHQTALCDADPESAGADLLLGLDETPGLRWNHLNPASGSPPGDRLFTSLPRMGDCAVITRDRSTQAMPDPSLIRSTIHALGASADLIVVDLPRSDRELRDELIAVCDLVFVVVTCDLRGATSAMNLVASIRDRADIRLLTRSRAGDSLDPDDVANWLDLPLVSALPNEPGIISAVDRGESICRHRRSRLAATCVELVRGVMR